MLRFGKNIDIETSSYSVSKCKLVSGGGAGPHQSGHRTGVILWSGKRRQAVFKECSALSVNYNFSLLWVHISVPGVHDIISWCQHVATKLCLPTRLQQLQNYVLSRHACICPLTNVYQAMFRVFLFLRMSTNQWISKQHPEVTKPSGVLVCQQYPPKMSTRQSLPSDARTCCIKFFLMLGNVWTIFYRSQLTIMDFLVITVQLS